jgi:hypothetical protein
MKSFLLRFLGFNAMYTLRFIILMKNIQIQISP